MKTALPVNYSLKHFFSFVLVCMLLAANSTAQTRYYVNNSIAASGDGLSWSGAFKTLQEAIDKTSQTVADEIWVAKGTYFPTKNVYGTRYEAPSWSRWMTFLITRPMKIYGGFAGGESNLSERNLATNTTTLSGDLNVPNDSSDNVYHTVIILGTEAKPLDNSTLLNGFTITGGYGIGTSGLVVNGESLESYRGGGILIKNASPVLSNLQVTGNNASLGSGIYTTNSSPLISRCNISGNKAYLEGGGVFIFKGAPQLSNVIISNNSAAVVGGGVKCGESHAAFSNVTITANSCARGAGISSVGDTALLESVTINDNIARIDGGAIYTESFNTVITLNQCEVRRNSAQFGGAMNLTRTVMTINNGNISENIASYYGGAFFVNKTTLRFKETNVTKNKTISYQAGGLFVEENSKVYAEGGSISENEGKTEGGGMLFRNRSSGFFTGTEFARNKSERSGGAIYLSAGDTGANRTSFTGVTFIENEAAAGGAMYINSTTIAFTDTKFTRNKAEGSGGGLNVSAFCDPELTRVTFEGNEGDYGGGLAIQSASTLKGRDLLFLGNKAIIEGGGIYSSASTSFTNMQFRGNTAPDGGGFSQYSGTAILTNLSFSGNLATDRGGGIYCERGTLRLTNVTLSANNATSGGAAYFNSSGSSSVRNTIMYGNSSGMGFVNGRPGVSYSLLQGWTTAATGNITGDPDPLLVDMPDFNAAPFVTGNFYLQPTSPVIDKGSNTFFEGGQNPDLSAINYDLGGGVRAYNSLADMGAFEYQPGTLPLNLLSFTAEAEKHVTHLRWTTDNEVNVSHFRVERGMDGSTFAAIGTLSASGRGSYNFDDNTVAAGVTYFYRLKMVDKDGSFTHSKVVMVQFDKPGIQYTIAPNPAASFINIYNATQGSQPLFVEMFNTLGAKLLQSRSSRIEVSRLPEGIYGVRITTPSGEVSVSRLLIKR